MNAKELVTMIAFVAMGLATASAYPNVLDNQSEPYALGKRRQ